VTAPRAIDPLTAPDPGGVDSARRSLLAGFGGERV